MVYHTLGIPKSVSTTILAYVEWRFQGYTHVQVSVLAHFDEQRRLNPARTAKSLCRLWLCPVMT